MISMSRALDELAAAIVAAQGGRPPRRVVTSVALRRQFGLPITPSRWAALERELGCPLPALEPRHAGLWSFPRGWMTVCDMADYLAGCRPGWSR